MKHLYENYAAIMLAVCTRYCSDREEAHDLMHEGFIKVFNTIDRYSGNGSLEGWIRRIMVNNALDAYNKKKKEREQSKAYSLEQDTESSIENKEELVDVLRKGPSLEGILKSGFSHEKLKECLTNIPEEYSVIFKLFVIERFTHKEIGEMLSLDERTSRTRLSRSRDMLKKELYKMALEKIGQ
jgi:RNA polymerase sigma-70 factor (ECF subfamily)